GGRADGAAGALPGVDGGGGDATLGACQQPGDCQAAHGAPPCGQWECRRNQCAVVCAQCTDNDRDGFGVGTGCAGPDCDDNDPTITSSGARACYEGKGGTLGVGACHAGAQVCSDGTWSPCSGQVLPSGEACNGLDDDCNGKTDDGLGTISCGLGLCAATAPACLNGVPGVCKPGVPALLEVCNDGKDNDCDGLVDDGCDGFCVHVAPAGDDMGTGTALRPFRSIQAAIDYAAGAPGRPKNVCVAGADTCLGAGTVYQSNDNATITMASGVSVLGNYEATGWTRCSFGTQGSPNLNVTIAPRAASGVMFGATVQAPTTLDGVRIARFSGGGGNGTIAGITISGGKQITISNVVIDDAMNAMTSYGVNLLNGGEAVITRSAIFGGAGTASSIGVHSVGSKPTIRENCAAIDPMTGHCSAPCAATGLGIHGRSPAQGGPGGNVDDGAAEAVAIDLVDSPGALVERTAVCGTFGATGVGVRIGGMAAGTIVRGNAIDADAATMNGYGVSMLACGDAAPWIVDNELLAGDPAGPATRAAGVNAAGACHPVIDSNTKIATGGSGAPMSAFGVYCGLDANAVSRCFVTGNKLVQGSPNARPAQTFAVACDAGGCARISGNVLVGQSGGIVVGLSLQGTGALVDRNMITGGCGSKSTTAVLAEDAFSRVENNVVYGGACGPGAATPEADGVRVHVAAGANEVDVDSNTIDAGGAGQCQSTAAGIGLGNGAGPKTPHGIFRNNILRGGGCNLGRVDFIETEAGVRPRLFENNDLDPTGPPTSLYLRPTASPMTIGAVNMLPGASANISADPMFVGMADLHLQAGSPCVNAGTSVGAPKLDFDGKARDDKPDIGAYER
ncbi:MAG TPA: choice-of-anchor Q domain-containing protein, partial [Polyangia bacterium]|nr:choice-of-anchor Q domain-containing protein [Polyangia bacterium]